MKTLELTIGQFWSSGILTGSQTRYALDGKKPFEVVAYALDYEAQGFSNALSKAIAERF